MKILIVDDVAIVRRVLRLTLEAKGHTILEAADGQEALAILEAETVDGVISDILMPNIDGFRLCYEIRKSEKTRDLPFIIHTQTYTSDHDKTLAGTVGVDQYLLKPASAAAILDALKDAREKRACHPPLPVFVPEENVVLKQYSQALVNKLEKRNHELQAALAHINELNETLEQRVTERTAELTQALSEVKELSGLLPICSYCKRIRDDKNYWSSVESYVTQHSKARFTHSFCPDCVAKHVLPMLNRLDVVEPKEPEPKNR